MIVALTDQKVRPRVRTVGIELEGGWKADFPNYGNITRDTSVVFEKPDHTPLRQKYEQGLITSGQYQQAYDLLTAKAHPKWIGEYPSPPIRISSIKGADLKTLTEWIKINYPPFVNKTCGMHIHMGFANSFTYQQLVTPDYQDTLINELLTWASAKLPADHHIFPRLNGENEYCQRKYFPDEQISVTGKDYDRHRVGCRYTIVHYCWGRYKTIEVRVLPMMPSYEMALDALLTTINITDRFLASTAKSARRGEKHQQIVNIDPSVETRSFLECV